MDISQLPKGAIPDPPDSRDFKAVAIMGTLVVDWNTPFKLPDPGNEDQGSSLSCVSQAWSYYHNQIHAANYSRRDLYARIFIPGSGGAYIRNGGYEITNRGQATRDEVPDPKPETETNMRDKTGVTQQAESSHKELNYFVLGGTIDDVAAGVKNYNGVVFGVTGSNPGWQDLSNPRPPKVGEETWGHALYAYGYHLHDGQKCIIAKSSWCNTGALEHHIKENYFINGFTFNPWTLIPKGQDMEFYQVQGEATIVAKLNGQYREIATPPELFPYVKKTLGIPDSLNSIGRDLVNANLGKQIVAGITF